ALSLTELIEYHGGAAMVLHNMANLYALQGENIAALQSAAFALEKAQISSTDEASYQKLVYGLFLTVQQEGVGYIRSKNYPQALCCLKASLPYAPQEKRAGLEKQISMLEQLKATSAEF
ncbi:MAG: hypothetical protein FWG43_03095, partial [Clostridiales bacterium]|nr:hypothetical protein [Clostridiales bacterium]